MIGVQVLIFLAQFGLGLMIGVPSGLNGKYWLDHTNAVGVGLSWSLIHKSFFAFADWNYEIKLSIGKINNVGDLFFYPGVGAFIGVSTERGFGAKIPLGIDFNFAKAPVNLFLEVSPSIRLIPETSPEIFGFIGGRYLFK